MYLHNYLLIHDTRTIDCTDLNSHGSIGKTLYKSTLVAFLNVTHSQLMVPTQLIALSTSQMLQITRVKFITPPQQPCQNSKENNTSKQFDPKFNNKKPPTWLQTNTNKINFVYYYVSYHFIIFQLRHWQNEFI